MASGPLIRFALIVALLAGGGIVVLRHGEGMAMVDAAARFIERADRYVRLSLGWPLRGTPDLARLDDRLKKAGVRLGDPIFMRIFKRESELELWVRHGDRFKLFATYPICRWSGRLGPKLKEGDRQSPEGFYTVSARQLNPKSRWHRSFNLGFPNVFDRAHGRTGSFLMVHGGCSSIGCFAMTNPTIDEIWRIVTASLGRGQGRFHVHVFPFRMTDWNLRLHRGHAWTGFWRDLKQGYDLFERHRVPPRISVCNRQYAVAPGKPGARGNQVIGAGCPGDRPLRGARAGRS